MAYFVQHSGLQQLHLWNRQTASCASVLMKMSLTYSTFSSVLFIAIYLIFGIVNWCHFSAEFWKINQISELCVLFPLHNQVLTSRRFLWQVCPFWYDWCTHTVFFKSVIFCRVMSFWDVNHYCWVDSSTSSWTVWTWKWWHCDSVKPKVLRICRTQCNNQKTWIFSNTPVTTSILALLFSVKTQIT
jgi:hypothetical protein